MNNHRLPTEKSGLRISVQFRTRLHSGAVFHPEYSAIKCDSVHKYAAGDSQGFVYASFGVARAFAQWLTPGANTCEISRAQWSSTNSETGEVEADIYPEFMADVLRKIRRLRARSLSVHSVSL